MIPKSLAKLNNWEDQVVQGNVSKDLFLTPQTTEGLRFTLKSMLDLMEYPTQYCGFSYVLTGRVYQDPSEVCLHELPDPQLLSIDSFLI